MPKVVVFSSGTTSLLMPLKHFTLYLHTMNKLLIYPDCNIPFTALKIAYSNLMFTLSKLFSCSLMYLHHLFKCVALSDEEKNENCQHLLTSDKDSDGKISPLEVCQRKIVSGKHFRSKFFFFSENLRLTYFKEVY